MGIASQYALRLFDRASLCFSVFARPFMVILILSFVSSLNFLQVLFIYSMYIYKYREEWEFYQE